MKTRLWFAGILVATLLLSACGAAGQEMPTAEPGTVVTPPYVTDTVVSVSAAVAASAGTEEPEAAPTFDCGNLVPDGENVNFTLKQETVCENTIPEKTYRDFMKVAHKTDMLVPALGDNFVPQGLDYWDEMGWILISGYFKPDEGHESSVLLGVDRNGRFVAEYELCNRDGTPHAQHDGGVAITGNNIYLSNGYKLFRIPLTELLQVGNRGTLQIAQEIAVPVAASFCNFANGILWVGEFYESRDYALKGDHIVMAEGGKTPYYAFCVGYVVEDRAGEDVLTLAPSYALSIPEKIQGFTALPDGRIVMTQSYGRKNKSAVFVCDDPLIREPEKYVSLMGASVPLWCLDQKNGREKTVAIPMTEGCCAVGDQVYILFESGAYYYRAYSKSNVALDPTDHIWCFEAP